ncbi:MAG: J domain-containing protein, partial [Candidatus Electrothrix sp. AR1]|nr:J domain-containing protein [Candidatus Electrothrix sp. AR1]
MQTEQLLVQKIASRPSTEELLFFIAEDDAITSACSDLKKKIARNNKKELEKIHALCLRYHISLDYLTRELNHIQSVFAPLETISDNHKILGLQAGANIAEVKQAYRKLSIKYHPDTSDQNDTAEFIKITKAYQRIINSTSKKENNVPPSPSAWRYRKNTPPPQQRKKKYLYLFSLVIGAIVLVIVSISVHYQKRAMLKNISMVTPTRSPISSPAEKTPAIVKEHLAEPHAPEVTEINRVHEVPKSSTPAVQPQVTDQKQRPLPTSKTSEQSPHQIHQDEIALVPPTPENMSHVKSPAPDIQTETEIKNLMSTAISFSDSHFNNEESSTQKSDQVEAKSIVRVKEKHSDLFSDIFKPEQPSEKIIQVTAPAVAAQQTSKQKEPSSLFQGARYHKAIVVKAKERKIRKKKLSASDSEQITPSISIQQSLREFVQSYTAVYMSRDITKFSLLFAEGSQENDIPFSKIRQKYKRLFKATKSIDYSIDLLKTDIRDKGASLTGRFKVQLIYTSKKTTSNTGTITFFLVKIKG